VNGHGKFWQRTYWCHFLLKQESLFGDDVT
jgi:hypothetical protein